MKLTFIVAVCGAVLGFSSAASAAECAGNPNALGTSRTVAIDPTKLPLIGFMQYQKMVELQPKEVILTFDDGPLPPSTNRVLEALRHECVKATFFIVGQMAKAYPNVLRQVAAEGHSIGTHSVTHPLIFTKLSAEKGRKEIDNGFAIVNDILAQDGRAAAPWFRFPGLGRTAAFENYLASRHISSLSVDFPVDDWLHIKPEDVYARALSRLEAHGKGMMLLHDIQPRTAAMLPTLLRTLKERGYSIVHIVPLGTPGVPVANAETKIQVASLRGATDGAGARNGGGMGGAMGTAPKTPAAAHPPKKQKAKPAATPVQPKPSAALQPTAPLTMTPVMPAPPASAAPMAPMAMPAQPAPVMPQTATTAPPAANAGARAPVPPNAVPLTTGTVAPIVPVVPTTSNATGTAPAPTRN